MLTYCLYHLYPYYLYLYHLTSSIIETTTSPNHMIKHRMNLRASSPMSPHRQTAYCLTIRFQLTDYQV